VSSGLLQNPVAPARAGFAQGKQETTRVTSSDDCTPTPSATPSSVNSLKSGGGESPSGGHTAGQARRPSRPRSSPPHSPRVKPATTPQP
jgi:hypothetical protein